MNRSWILLPLLGLLVLPFQGRSADVESLKPINIKNANTAQDEDDPHVATSGLQLFYASNASGKWDILVSKRQNLGQDWPAGKRLPDLEGKADYRSVFLMDARYPVYLYFATNKDPETEKKGDNFDLYYLAKQGPQSDFTDESAVNAVDTAADELHPWLTANGLKLYFSRKDPDGWHVYVSSKPAGGGQWGTPEQVKLPVGFHHASLTPDGKTVYLQGPLEKDRWGLFRSTLAAGAWSEPEALEGLNNAEGPTGDQSPCLSRDGSKLYFSSDRPGGQGGLDLWVISTAQLRKKE